MESLLIKEFKNCPLNCVFLKNPERMGPGQARNVGIENSYNKYVFMLDADDYFCVNNALERMYYKAIEQDYLLLHFYMYPDPFTNKTNKPGLLINRELLSDIRYTKLFFGEDQVFNTAIIASAPIDRVY